MISSASIGFSPRGFGSDNTPISPCSSSAPATVAPAVNSVNSVVVVFFVEIWIVLSSGNDDGEHVVEVTGGK